MKLKQCLLIAIILCSGVEAANAQANAQALDTLRRKDADGWEFFQVRRGTTVYREGYNHNGVAEGTWVDYWENGYPATIVNYVHGKKSGSRMQVSQQGYTEAVEHYKDDLLDGPVRRYQQGSNYISEETFYSDGKKHGKYSKRYVNGKPQEEATFNMDQRDGKTTWYYEDGNKAAEYSYRNGLMEGEVSSYHKNGRVSEFGMYKNNEQTGAWKEFYENGSLKAEGSYVSGKKEGPWKEYDEKGKLAKTIKYKNGEAK